jgi:gas vesicle protein GvpA/GvpJ/GvpM family
MARRKRSPRSRDWLFPNLNSAPEVETESSLLDVVDRVLNKGAVLNGDVFLGVANVDLVYAKLSVLLSALDKVMNDPPFKPIAAGPRRKRKRAKR